MIPSRFHPLREHDGEGRTGSSRPRGRKGGGVRVSVPRADEIKLCVVLHDGVLGEKRTS